MLLQEPFSECPPVLRRSKSEEAQLRYYPISSTESQRAARRSGLAAPLQRLPKARRSGLIARVHRDSGWALGNNDLCALHGKMHAAP